MNIDYLTIILTIFIIPGEDIAHDPELIKREVISNFAKNFPTSYLRVVQHSDLSAVTWAP